MGFALVEVTGRVGVVAPAKSVCKRALDVLGAAFILVFFLPIGALTLVAIRCSRRGPILVRETTVGLNGRPFRRWRFHRPGESENVFDQLIWRAGLIDLPSAVNVIGGEMSLIGPRPHSPQQYDYLRKGRPDYARRFEARPGMIGPTLGDDEPSLNADLDYVSGWSPFLDLKVAGLYAAQGLFREKQTLD